MNVSITNKQITRTFWIYLLYCNNDAFYTGYTVNIKKRYREHVTGKSKCKYTRSFKPLYLAQCWKIDNDKALAMRVERYIKKLSRSEKQSIIDAPHQLKAIFNVEVITIEDLRKFCQ
jgi:putative endonuclease